MLDEKTKFAARLNEALDASLPNVPVKGKGRQAFVASMFKVSQKGARKWLEGEALPKMEQCITIAIKLKVGIEWLLTGRGGRRMLDQKAAQDRTAEVIDIWLMMPPDVQSQWLNYGEFLVRSTRKNPPIIPEITSKTRQ